MNTDKIHPAQPKDSAANCGNRPGAGPVEALGSQPRVALSDDHTNGRPDTATDYTFQIFRDWQGLYRWMLTDALGRRLATSRFSFSAAGTAFRDLELVRAEARYTGARIQDNTGR